MPKPLVPTGTLITQSFQQFTRDWNKTFIISAWFIVGPLLTLSAALLERSLPSTAPWLTTIFSLTSAIITLWVTIRLMRWTLWRDAGQSVPKDEAVTAWNHFWPIVWVAVLEFLAVMGGLVVFVFPGIWISILLIASRYIYLEEGKRGTQALAASAQLVKGRWWPVFWRVVAPGIVFLLIYTLGESILTTIIGLFAGPAKLNLLIAGTQPVASAFQYVIQGINQAIFLPLFIVWQVKLFHSLKESR